MRNADSENNRKHGDGYRTRVFLLLCTQFGKVGLMSEILFVNSVMFAESIEEE